MASPPTSSEVDEKVLTVQPEVQCASRTTVKQKSVPGNPLKPPVAAKPSRRPAPPPPPKPQSLKLTVSPPLKNSPSCEGKEGLDSIKNGRAKASKSSSLKKSPSNSCEDLDATEPGGSSLQRPPLPTSLPPVQRKSPLSPSSSVSLPASFRNQTLPAGRKTSLEKIKNSPSPPSVPFQPQASPRKTCGYLERSDNESPSIKTVPIKPPKPAVPPKTVARAKALSPSTKPTLSPVSSHSHSPLSSSNNLDQEEVVQTKLNEDSVKEKNSADFEQNIVTVNQDQSKSGGESNSLVESSKISLHPSPPQSNELIPHIPSTTDRSDHDPIIPETLEKCSPVVASHNSGEPVPEASTKPTPKKPPPPPLPKNPPRGGLPRKTKSFASKKPERPAPPKLTSQNTSAANHSPKVHSNLTESQEAETVTQESGKKDLGEECSPQADCMKSGSQELNTQEETEVSHIEPTPPKPRPRKSLSIPTKPPEEQEKKQVESVPNSHHKDIIQTSTSGEVTQEEPCKSSQRDTASVQAEPLPLEDIKPSEPTAVQEDFPQKNSNQPELELDYVEVYRGEDGERHLRGLDLSKETNLEEVRGEESCASISLSASRESLANKSLEVEEPGPTCGMLKEIEDLLNKKLEDFDSHTADLYISETDFKETTNVNVTDNDSVSEHSVSLSSSPIRPPRPKHKASLALRKGSIDSLTLSPQSGSRESLTSLGSEKKVAPPKPKRNSTPRVSRSYSDVSGLKSPVVEGTDGEDVKGKFPLLQSNGKPYLPPRSESLRKNEFLISGSESPPPLPPRNRSRTALETSSSNQAEPPPPLPERVSLISKSQLESKDIHRPEEMNTNRNSGPSQSDAWSAVHDSEERNEEAPDISASPRSSVLRPVRKAPAPPSTAPRRSATFGPGDAKSLTAFKASENIDRISTSTSSEEPDYHEIPPEGLQGRSLNQVPKLSTRVARSKSLCSKEGPTISTSSSDSREDKGSSLEKDSSLKSKNKKEEQQTKGKKNKTALINRVTQGLGLKKTFRKSKSPESISSKTSNSSSEIEADGPSDSKVDHRVSVSSCKEDSAQLDELIETSNSVRKDSSSGGYENDPAHISTETPVTIKVITTEGNNTEEKESELPSPAMERLGMEDLESEVMSALSSGGIGSSFNQDSSLNIEDRRRSYRSTSTSSEREAGDENGEEQEGEAISSASDSEPEPEEDKEEIYAIRKAKKVFFIAKEIMSSESVFVDVLKLLNVDFRVHISEATEKLGQPVIATSIINKILAYLPQLQDFNEDLLRDLSERIKNWEDNPRLADIFVKKGPFLKLYSSYIRNFETSTATLDEATKKNAQFAAALKEFEMSPRCASLALKHYMLKPIQRIPQYKLLLQDYLKQLNPASIDFKDTLTALNIVSEVADHANESMRHGDNVQKLLEIQRSLVGSFEVIQPGRVLVMRGELEKVSRKEMQPRMFFLFSDVLLYTTPVTTGNKINNILPLIGMKVISPKHEDHENEFNIISVQRSFTLCASTPALKKQWVESLQKAIEENAKRHNTFEAVKQGPQTSLLDKDFVLGHKAPLWVPDARVTMCMLCLVEFTLTWRRHHCRSCGRIICAQCSQNKAPLRYLKYKPSRVCDECFDKLKEDVAKEAANEKNKKKKASIAADDDSNLSITEDATSSSFATDSVDGESMDQADEASDAGGDHHESGLSLHSLLGRFTKIRSSNTRHQRVTGNLRPSVLREVRANDEGSDMSGYLHTFKSRKWKKMWFVVKGNVLYTYKASADMAAVESMPLLGYEVSEFESVFEGAEPSLLIELRHQNNQPLTSRASKSLSGADRAMQRTVLKTENTAATSKWLAVLRQASQT